jgi:transposase
MSDLIELTGKQRVGLEHLLTHHSDSRLYQRAFALLLLDDGQSVEEVAAALRVSRQTTYNWVCRFQRHVTLAKAYETRLPRSDACAC